MFFFFLLKYQNIELNDLFLLALERNQVEFVKLFLDHDFSLTDLFRNKDKLLALYMNEVNKRTLYWTFDHYIKNWF